MYGSESWWCPKSCLVIHSSRSSKTSVFGRWTMELVSQNISCDTPTEFYFSHARSVKITQKGLILKSERSELSAAGLTPATEGGISASVFKNENGNETFLDDFLTLCASSFFTGKWAVMWVLGIHLYQTTLDQTFLLPLDYSWCRGKSSVKDPFQVVKYILHYTSEKSIYHSWYSLFH